MVVDVFFEFDPALVENLTPQVPAKVVHIVEHSMPHKLDLFIAFVRVEIS